MRAKRRTDKEGSRDVLAFLTEFASLLLDAGFSSSQFTQLAELAFFRAASEDSRFRNARINQSSVAAMTGLNRAKIRSLASAEQKKIYARPQSTRERLLTAWLTEPEFLTSLGAPRRLSLGGAKGSFESLAKKYGNDIPPRALVRELQRRQMVRVSNGYVQVASNAREIKEIKRLEHLSAAIARTISAPSGSRRGCAMKVLSFEIAHPAPDAVGRILLQRRIAKSLRGFMVDLEAACHAITKETSTTKASGRRRGKTSVLLLNQD